MLLVVAVLLLATGCGGGGSSEGTTDGTSGGNAKTSHSSAPKAESASEAKARGEIKKIVDAKLPEFELSSDQIACVDENIATMTSQEMTAGVVKPSGAETAEAEEETAENYLGPLAKGCL